MPKIVTLPPSRRSCPEIMEMVVDLPAPLTPRKAKSSPRQTRNEKVSNGLYLSESFIQSVNADDFALGRSGAFTAQVVILCVTH